MAVSREGTTGTASPHYCPECGHPCKGERFCAECGHAIATASAQPDATAELPRPDWQPPAPASQPATRPPAIGRSRSRIVLMAAAGALALAAVAVIAIILLNGSSGSSARNASSPNTTRRRRHRG